MPPRLILWELGKTSFISWVNIQDRWTYILFVSQIRITELL
jgi:hypothetical protein